METTNKLKDINEVLEFLYQEFPQCFKAKEGIKPLKVGIFKDIAERIEGSEKVSKTQVRQALRKYTSQWRYLESVTKNEFRIDLDGNQAEKIEQEHVEHATKALEESRAKMAKRKKAQAPRGDKKRPAGPRTAKTGHSSKKYDKAAKDGNAKTSTAKRSTKVEPLASDNVSVNTKVKVKLGQPLLMALSQK